jgi:hypothetical protein
MGNPIPCEDIFLWSEWMEKANRHVGEDILGDIRVSTIFLGLDHNYHGGKPILYETMIFGGPNDQYQQRYYTKEEALKEHAYALSIAEKDCNQE